MPLNRERIALLLPQAGGVLHSRQKRTDTRPAAAPAYAPVTVAQKPQTNPTTSHMQQPVQTNAHTDRITRQFEQARNSQDTLLFIQWVLDESGPKIFGVIRTMNTEGRDPVSFMSEIVHALDGVYRARLEGRERADSPLGENLAHFTDAELEQLISIFSHAADYGYASPYVAANTALINALAFMRENRESK